MARVNGPSWRVTGFYYPSTRPWKPVTHQLGPLTRAINSGSGNRALLIHVNFDIHQSGWWHHKMVLKNWATLQKIEPNGPRLLEKHALDSSECWAQGCWWWWWWWCCQFLVNLIESSFFVIISLWKLVNWIYVIGLSWWLVRCACRSLDCSMHLLRRRHTKNSKMCT